jgi:hypothetical protein
VFLVNSRYPLVTATTLSSGSKSLHQAWHTFFRSYGANLPSSLDTVLSSALGYSPRLPVSVCGTDTNASTHARLFLEAWNHYLTATRATPSPLDVWTRLYSYGPRLQAWTGTSDTRRSYPSPSPLMLHEGGTGILTCSPSPTPFGLGLGSD